VRKAHGKPRPSRMSKMLLPIELDTAMSPIPAAPDTFIHSFIDKTEHVDKKRKSGVIIAP